MNLTAPASRLTAVLSHILSSRRSNGNFGWIRLHSSSSGNLTPKPRSWIFKVGQQKVGPGKVGFKIQAHEKKKKKKQKIKKPENPPKKKKTKKNQKKQLDRYESGSSAPSRVPFLDHCYSSPGLSFFFSYFLHKDCHESNNGVCSLFTTFSAFQLWPSVIWSYQSDNWYFSWRLACHVWCQKAAPALSSSAIDKISL